MWTWWWPGARCGLRLSVPGATTGRYPCFRTACGHPRTFWCRILCGAACRHVQENAESAVSRLGGRGFFGASVAGLEAGVSEESRTRGFAAPAFAGCAFCSNRCDGWWALPYGAVRHSSSKRRLRTSYSGWRPSRLPAGARPSARRSCPHHRGGRCRSPPNPYRLATADSSATRRSRPPPAPA
jgi:hypothetical protein